MVWSVSPTGTPYMFPVLGAAGVSESVRGLRPFRLRAIAVVGPEVPNVDPSTSPTQITCLYALFGITSLCALAAVRVDA